MLPMVTLVVVFIRAIYNSRHTVSHNSPVDIFGVILLALCIRDKDLSGKSLPWRMDPFESALLTIASYQ